MWQVYKRPNSATDFFSSFDRYTLGKIKYELLCSKFSEIMDLVHSNGTLHKIFFLILPQQTGIFPIFKDSRFLDMALICKSPTQFKNHPSKNAKFSNFSSSS
jgi:hypothetical protein